MLLLPLLLLVVLFPSGGNEDDKSNSGNSQQGCKGIWGRLICRGGSNEEVFREPVSFYLIQISSFANKTWAQNQGSGWLDELQTHGWESELGTIIFLHAWPKGNFSDTELMDLELLFRVYFIGFIREIQDHASALKLELRPQVWLSSSPTLSPDWLLLVCHVSGFYPKPLWMRAEQEQPDTKQGDILPRADGTW
ncbi:T-cell surface glycoprotein CD1b-like [Dugong dugon]